MNFLKITLIVIIAMALCVGVACSAPKEDKDNNGRGIERSEAAHAAQHGRDLKGGQGNLLRQTQAGLEYSRWWYNPNDDRGQGNMGEVTMLSPYGQDKDSDRMELYGNRGRVITEEPAPEPPPEPTPPPPEPTPDPEPTPEPPPNYPPF